MIRDLLEHRGPSPAKDIRLLEEALPSPLPEDYRSWLLRNNGAYLSEDVILPNDNGNAILQELLSPRQTWGFYPGWGNPFANIPLQFLAVGYGSGGAVCLCLDDKEYGSVWFADFDMALSILEEDERSMEIMMRLADDWEAFLNSR